MLILDTDHLSEMERGNGTHRSGELPTVNRQEVVLFNQYRIDDGECYE